ncbi:hypothetical protein TNCV_4516401, partial [Trichonephila clavipes]
MQVSKSAKEFHPSPNRLSDLARVLLLLYATGCYQIQHRSEETPAKSFLVCVRLRQRSLLLLTGLFTHKSLRD